MLRQLILVLVPFCFLSFCRIAAAASIKRIPGSKVKVSVPDDFSPAQGVAALMAPGKGLVTHISYLKKDPSGKVIGLENAVDHARGFGPLLSQESLKVHGRGAILARAKMENVKSGGDIWILGQDGGATLEETQVVFLKPEFEDQAKAIALSADFNPAQELDPFDGFNYRFDLKEPYQKNRSTSAALFFSPNGSLSSGPGISLLLLPNKGAPALTVKSVQKIVLTNAAKHGRRLEAPKEVKIGSLRGFEFQGTDDESRLISDILEDGEVLVIVERWAPKAAADKELKVLNEMVKTIRRNN
jgi:hypothetical protein